MPPQQQRPYQEIGLDQKQQQTLAMLHTDAVNNLPPAQHALKTAIKKLQFCVLIWIPWTLVIYYIILTAPALTCNDQWLYNDNSHTYKQMEAKNANDLALDWAISGRGYWTTDTRADK